MSANAILLEAIALKKCVTATYNGVLMTLAPHILYSKNGALYVDAIPLEKHGEPAREKKLAAFHLQGLNDVRIIERSFERDALFEPDAEKYTAALFAVSED